MGIGIRAGLTVVLTLGVSVSAQVSLKDMARQNGGKALTKVQPNLPLTTMPELVSKSETIVHARIARAVSKLTPDETMVVTEYELAPLKFFRQRAPAQSRVPTGPVPLVMRIPAGRVYVDGLELVFDNSAFPEPWLHEGDECVVFLQYDSGLAEYIPYGGPHGIFRVVNGRVSPLTEFVAGKRHDTEKDLGSFAAELQQLMIAK
jgi:hypothetical protein